jgi:hypothetical protein
MRSFARRRVSATRLALATGALLVLAPASAAAQESGNRDRAVDVPAEGRSFAVSLPKPKPMPRAKQRLARRAQAEARGPWQARTRPRVGAHRARQTHVVARASYTGWQFVGIDTPSYQIRYKVWYQRSNGYDLFLVERFYCPTSQCEYDKPFLVRVGYGQVTWYEWVQGKWIPM